MLFRGKVTMATADRCRWKEGENTGLISSTSKRGKSGINYEVLASGFRRQNISSVNLKLFSVVFDQKDGVRREAVFRISNEGVYKWIAPSIEVWEKKNADRVINTVTAQLVKNSERSAQLLSTVISISLQLKWKQKEPCLSRGTALPVRSP